ncbi:MAG TPA: hypothetical protein VJT67_16310, partial [Longimicrobiaceae bacterium]|nr:hypothetical protein [Longimicrobiaceae bacterium]
MKDAGVARRRRAISALASVTSRQTKRATACPRSIRQWLDNNLRLSLTEMDLLKGILGLFAVGAAAVALGARAQMRRARHARTRATYDDLSGWVNRLLLQFAPGSCLVAELNDGRGFLQLAVTGREAEWRQVEFGLPDAEWARENFALAVVTLEEGAGDARVEHNPGNAEIPRFLSITFSGERNDVARKATNLLRRAAAVLEFPADATFSISLQGDDDPEYYRHGAAIVEEMGLPRWIGR